MSELEDQMFRKFQSAERFGYNSLLPVSPRRGAHGPMSAPVFSKGDEVRHKHKRHAVGVVVEQPRLIANEYWYQVRFADRRESVIQEDLEAASNEHAPGPLLLQNAWGGKETLSKIVTFKKLSQPLTDVVYSFRASRTEFHAYQFKPLLKILDSPTGRLLIADEVGLGKTIEAGYIMQELRARGPLNRILVVCPSALRQKWRDELWNRFDERFEIIDSQGVRELLNRIDREGPGISFRSIVSLQTLRGAKGSTLSGGDDRELKNDWERRKDRVPSLLDTLEAANPPLDLVIVDEAHHMRNRATSSNRLGRVLSEIADVLVMLTATPIHIGSENLFNLLRILDPSEFDNVDLFNRRMRTNQLVVEAERVLRMKNPADLAACLRQLRLVEQTGEAMRYLSNPFYSDLIEKLTTYDGANLEHVTELQRDLNRINTLTHVFTRTRKREVQVHRPVRRASVIRPAWRPDEAEFYETVTEYCRAKYLAQHGQLAAEFAVITIQRQMASCIPALLGTDADPRLVQSKANEFSEAEDALGDTDLDLDSEYRGIREDPEFLDLLKEWKGRITVDSKFDALLKTIKPMQLERPARKVIIFSYFKRTLAYLNHRLGAASIRCEVIHGGVPSRPFDPDNDERGNRLRRFREDPAVTVLLSSEVGSEGLDFQFCNTLVNYDLPWNPMVVEQRIGRLDRLGQKSESILIFNFSIPDTIEDRILTRLYNRIRIFEQTIGDLEPIIGDEIRRLTHDILSTRLSPQELDTIIDQRVRALETRRQQELELEQESGRFVGHDQYFMEELERIQNRTRYFSAAEVETFVREFLELEFPERMWNATSRKSIFELKWTKDLDSFVRNHHNQVEREGAAFFQRAHRKPLLMTCNGEAAFSESSCELLTANHPFIRAIVRHYEHSKDRLHPVSAIQLEAQGMPESDFLYFLFQVDTTGARPTRRLVPVFVNPDGQILDESRSESLLAAMITQGVSLESRPVVPPDLAEKLKTIAHEELIRRINIFRDQKNRLNEALASQRLESLRASFELKRSKWMERLRNATNRQAKESYINLVEGTLRNMDFDFEKKSSLIEAERRLSVDWDWFAAGIVRMVSCRR